MDYLTQGEGAKWCTGAMLRRHPGARKVRTVHCAWTSGLDGRVMGISICTISYIRINTFSIPGHNVGTHQPWNNLSQPNGIFVKRPTF
jgi:hypothetical protein